MHNHHWFQTMAIILILDTWNIAIIRVIMIIIIPILDPSALKVREIDQLQEQQHPQLAPPESNVFSIYCIGYLCICTCIHICIWVSSYLYLYLGIFVLAYVLSIWRIWNFWFSSNFESPDIILHQQPYGFHIILHPIHRQGVRVQGVP